jgi:hypothetical protein
MRLRVNTLLVCCILLTVATAMLLASGGINQLITTPNDLRLQSAGYGELTLLLILVFVTWTGLIKSDWKAWFVILAIALLWEYPIFARDYVKHYGLALPIGMIRELAFIGSDDKTYIQILLGIYGCFLTLAALALSALSVFLCKCKEVRLDRRFVLATVSILVVLLSSVVWARLHESSIPPEELSTFIALPPPPPPSFHETNSALPLWDVSACSCPK